MQPQLFSIGHSTHSFDRFLELLHQWEIEVVADVRSKPGSRWAPIYKRNDLEGSILPQRGRGIRSAAIPSPLRGE